MIVQGKLNAYGLGAALIAVIAAALTFYAQRTLKDDVRVQAEAVAHQIATTQAQIDSLEQTLTRLEAASCQREQMLDSSPDKYLDLRERVARLEPRRAEISGLDPAATKEHFDQQTPANLLADHLRDHTNASTPASVANIFARERGSSRWGDVSAARVREEYVREPWFHIYGGDLKTQCRRTTCKIEWVVSTVDNNDGVFALAEYELMAAATRNAEKIGRTQAERRIENGRTIVTVYLQRR